MGDSEKSCFPTVVFHSYYLNLKISCSFWGLIVQHIWLNYHLRSWDGVFSPVISERRNSRFRFLKYHNIFRTHQNTEGFQSFLNMFFSSQKALCDFQGSYRHQHGRVFFDSSQRWSCCGLWHAPCERI